MSSNARDDEPPIELTTRQMRTFCAVYELGGYTPSARRLGQSTTAIWEQVKEIERQYGTPLFRRRGRQVVALPLADHLYEMLRPLLAGLDSTREVLREIGHDRPREIRIAVGVRMLIEEVGRGLREFQRKNEDIRLRVLETHSRSAESVVVAGEADLVMTLQPGPGFTSDAVTLEPAYEIDYMAIAPPRHPLRQCRKIDMGELVKYPLILWQNGVYSRHLVEQALHREGLLQEMKIAVETDNSAFTAACVRAGLGVGILAGQPSGPLCKGLFVQSIESILGRPRIVFVWKRGALLSPILRDLADTIRDNGRSSNSPRPRRRKS